MVSFLFLKYHDKIQSKNKEATSNMQNIDTTEEEPTGKKAKLKDVYG